MSLNGDGKLHRVGAKLSSIYDVREMTCRGSPTGVLEVRPRKPKYMETTITDESTVEYTGPVAYVDQSFYGRLEVGGPGSAHKNSVERIVASGGSEDAIQKELIQDCGADIEGLLKPLVQ